MSTAAAPAPARAPGDRFVGRKYVQLVLLGGLSAIRPLTIDTYLPALPADSAPNGCSSRR